MRPSANDCPVCDNKKPLPVVLKNDQFMWFHCDSCDHVFQYPPTITAKYDAKYVADRYDAYSTTESMSWLRLGLVKSVCASGKLLDVGYGNGSFIKIATKGGFDAYGCDVHGCGEKYGVRERGLLGEIWDVVTFFDSLEHFPDLSQIKRLRARNIIVSMPYRECESIPSLEWKHLRPGEHLHQFSIMSLGALFQNVNMFFHTKFVDLEDPIRGKLNGNINIMTMVFSTV